MSAPGALHSLAPTPREMGQSNVVSLTAATTLSRASHEGRILVLNAAAGFNVTLPAATGSGDRYEFIVGTAITSNNYVLIPAGSDVFTGNALSDDGDGEPANGWTTASNTNRITLGGTSNATGGSKGDRVVLTDVASGLWHVSAFLTQGGTEATPFSNA